MTNPLVSIGMPVYNGERWLQRALDSLLLQDYDNFEIIISENGSTDDSYKICCGYAAEYENIRLIRQQNTIPLIDNFSEVLGRASGKYFMWAAVDDNWDAAFVSNLTEKLESNESFAVAQAGVINLLESDLTNQISSVRFIGKNNPEFCFSLQLTEKIVSPFKYNLFIYGLFRTGLLQQAFRYVPNVPSSDRWFLLQFPLAGYRFGYVDKPLYIRTIRELPLYLRYQEDSYAKQIKSVDKKWFDFSGLPAVKKMLNSSSMLNNCGNTIKTIVLLQLFYGRIKIGIMLMVKTLIVSFLPKNMAIILLGKLRAHRQHKRGTFK